MRTTDAGSVKSVSLFEKQTLDYSIVIPVFNSEKSLTPLCEKIAATLHDFSFEIILINDGSFDASWDIILQLRAQFPSQIVAIDLAKNAGQHAAVFCGFHFAKGENIITIDDDLQILPEEILKLTEQSQSTNADLVYGLFKEKKHSRFRNFGSKIIGNLFNKMASTPAKGSSFKLIKKELVKKVIRHNNQHIYIDELLGWHSGHTSFVTVAHQERTYGKSGYSALGLIRIAMRLLINYTALPLKMITYLGVLSSLISFGIGGYYIYQKYTFGAEMGFTSLIVAIFFSTGLILLSLGIIGEYLNRIFMMQMGKPPFKIKTILE